MFPRDGSILFGYCLDILLYGILTAQTYLYYISFPKDRQTTKATVAFVYIIGTIQTAFALHDFYSLFCVVAVSQKRPVAFLEKWLDLHRFGFMWLTIPLSGASVAFVSQLFYAHRIYILSGKKLIPGVVIGLALTQMAIGILVTFASYGNWEITTELSQFSHFLDLLVWELSGAICDLIITIDMFRFFSRHIKQSFRPMRISLTRIKLLTLESGLITTTLAMSYVVLPFFLGSEIFILPGLALSKVYGNSLLALLNNRLRIPDGRKEVNPCFEFDIVTVPLEGGWG